MTSTPGAGPTTRTTATLTLVAMAGIVVPLFLRTSDDLARWLVTLALLGMAFAIALTYRHAPRPLTGDGAARTSRLLLLEAILIAVLGITGLGSSDAGSTAISIGQFAVAALVAAGAWRLFRYSRTAPAEPEA